MKTEIHTLLKTRGISMLGKDEIEQLQTLEAAWQALKAREANVMPLRVAEHQKAAHAAFLADMSIENEMHVAILTDTPLTLSRYAARRNVIADGMKLLASKAGELLRPLSEEASLALQEEMELRKEQKTTCWADSDPRVKECQKWIDAMVRAGSRVLHATSRECEFSPMELAELFLPDAPAPEGGK
jgi:hypothetical protein